MHLEYTSGRLSAWLLALVVSYVDISLVAVELWAFIFCLELRVSRYSLMQWRVKIRPLLTSFKQNLYTKFWS